MLANIEYIPTASPVVVHNGTQFVMELDPPRRFVGYAWAFLEDVYRMRTVDMSGDNRLWHTARMLGACATNLRNACEAHFGRGNLHLAPDPNVMWFITGARHLSAHASKMPGVPLNAMKLNVHINNVTDIGWMEADTSLSIDIDLSDDLKVTKHRDDARRFLHAYQGKLYLALHAATRKVAEWVQMPLDPDFEKMGNQDYGRILLRIPLKTAAARQRVLSAISNGGDMEVPLDELERKGWDINGHWMPENGSTKTEPSNAAHQPGPG